MARTESQHDVLPSNLASGFLLILGCDLIGLSFRRSDDYNSAPVRSVRQTRFADRTVMRSVLIRSIAEQQRTANKANKTFGHTVGFHRLLQSLCKVGCLPSIARSRPVNFGLHDFLAIWTIDLSWPVSQFA